MDIIELNVGGKHFMTTLQTLTQYSDSFLGVMFSNRFQLSFDKKGRVFIDRDGDLFHHILSFLRSGSDNVGFTTKDSHFHLIINEFQYFGLLHHLILSSSRPFYQSITPPSKFSFSRVALLSGHIYIFGLRNSAPLVEIYNPLMNRWDSNRTDMFPIRGPYISMALELYACGDTLAELKQYDTKMNKWITVPMKLVNCQDTELIDFSWCTYKEYDKTYQPIQVYRHQQQMISLSPNQQQQHQQLPTSNNNVICNRHISYLLGNERQKLSIYCVDTKYHTVSLVDTLPFAHMSLECACLIVLSNCLYAIGEDYFIEMFDISRNQCCVVNLPLLSTYVHNNNNDQVKLFIKMYKIDNNIQYFNNYSVPKISNAPTTTTTQKWSEVRIKKIRSKSISRMLVEAANSRLRNEETDIGNGGVILARHRIYRSCMAAINDLKTKKLDLTTDGDEYITTILENLKLKKIDADVQNISKSIMRVSTLNNTENNNNNNKKENKYEEQQEQQQQLQKPKRNTVKLKKPLDSIRWYHPLDNIQ
ncbi:hypothetical protein PPL_10035 [Heterostelium album PN500]|uniref:BTB domain-containing protein n=1 Tax=Heterostelium pallidum (strain ATCC 26659 / Pp 5 / PN500) TaxID=670386 RepID=D3BQ54_HETP5|nr:hypothetical protein PPL_10035 [Heterostelium album PN500]EFA76274.1 hypothetical protein PPL_10035 [Heterostelium album PN500]|eukprot:XP_020428406.1 hypothetical protein PPL_10035 [Heterostelium album PN500]